MDKSLLRTWSLSILMVLTLLVNVTYIQGFQAAELRDDPLNARRYQDRFTVDRGPIVAAGERLAWSVRADGTPDDEDDEDDARRSAQRRYRRVYRDGPAFAPVTGYFSLFSDSGLERSQNAVLDGTDDRLAAGDLIDQLVGRPIEGGTVETTIEPDAQRAAYESLAGSTRQRAAAVALDARTGAVRVMASYPSYDPGELATLDARRADLAFKRLQADTFRQPMLNKAAGETFPPGSSFKTVVAAAALAAGMSPRTQVRAGSSYTPPDTDRAIGNSHDSGGCGEARTTLVNAFAQSCNTTFAQLGAERLGNARVREEAAKLGFERRIALAPKLKSAAGHVPDAGPAGTALASIGQGDTRATVLQMAMVAAAAANDGRTMRPHLVARIRSAGERVAGETLPRTLDSAMGAGDARALRSMMAEVVRSGTARNLRDDDIAGKTGTADVDGRSFNERWFVGFGPVKDPRHAVAVVTEGPGSGGVAAGPIAAEILHALEDSP